ncbi:MAG: hypothetical protein QY326_00850 [Bdellovibrionota bacterium]|nr:MAG: hypothetical protein QY326_00850 [Bdellovibrionota bacterium]
MADIDTTRPLTQREELLLMKHVDGECRFWERWLAEKLLRTNAEAQRFLDSLGTMRKDVQSCCGSAGCGCSVWSNVRARITQEERSAVLLGARLVHAVRRPAIVEFLSRPASAWAATAVAACCVLVVSYQGLDSSNVDAGAQLALQSDPRGPFGKQLVSSPSVAESAALPAKASAYVAPRILEERIPSSVEVDWLRGNGRVRLIPDSQTRAPIIWVKRKSTAALRQQLVATPTYGALRR